MPSRHLAIECCDTYGSKFVTRKWGLKNKDLQIWRVTAVHTPIPFSTAS
jgi:hypothetical protein